MRLTILGTGAVGLASAAIAASRGHEVTLWSPTGAFATNPSGGQGVQSTGALAGCWPAVFARTIADALDGADAVLLAADAGAHRAVMDQALPHLSPGTPFIVSTAHSMSGVYLAGRLAARGVRLPVVSWNTSAATAHRTAPGTVDIRVVRASVEACVTPAAGASAALAACDALFPARFDTRGDALAIALLSNCNPVFHVPVCLMNLGRIDAGEDWRPYAQTSVSIGRVMEGLDRERLDVAAAFGIAIHSVNEHFHRSFAVPLASMHRMNADLHARGRGPVGPKSVAHRYLMQDIPYGLVFAAAVARVAGVPTPVHDAMILLAETALDRDLASVNDLIPSLGLAGMGRDELLLLATHGRPAARPNVEGTSR